MNIQQLVGLCPEIKGKRFDDLVTNIKKNGLLHPIVRHNGEILDGRARLRACKLAHVEPAFIEFADLKLPCSPDEYLWAMNVERRHLTADQRAVLVFEWAKVLKEEAKSRQLAALNQGDKPGVASRAGTTGTTRHALANKAFTTTHKIQQVEVVKKHSPRLIKKVASGKMKLREAAKIANAKRRKVIPIRKVRLLTVSRAVKMIMAGLVADIKPIVERVADKKQFYHALRDHVMTYCRGKEDRAVA